MGSVAEGLVTDVLTEAFDEVIGRSNRKWAAMLAAAIVGAIIAAAIMRRRRRGGKVGVETH